MLLQESFSLPNLVLRTRITLPLTRTVSFSFLFFLTLTSPSWLISFYDLIRCEDKFNVTPIKINLNRFLRFLSEVSLPQRYVEPAPKKTLSFCGTCARKKSAGVLSIKIEKRLRSYCKSHVVEIIKIICDKRQGNLEYFKTEL